MTPVYQATETRRRGGTVAAAFGLVAALCVCAPVSAGGLHPVFSAALRGDMTAALRILDTLDYSTFSPRDSLTAECIRSTFASPPQEEDLPPLPRTILTAYRRYWQDLMLQRDSVPGAEARLLRALNEVFAAQQVSDTAFTSLDEAGEAAKQAIQREGLFALTGVTLPYYELMLWKTQTPRTYEVQLPGQGVEVHVVFLNQFVSLGWAAYATCGRSFSGGWATRDSLFAVQSGYDTTSEQFRVSYLAHEGQHFADYGLYPQLEQPELEYRAKLTEITVSDESTHHLVLGFPARTGQDRAVPHHFADYCVVRDLSRLIFDSDLPVTDPDRWHSVPARRLRHEAERLLRQNDDDLRRAGATTVRQFLTIKTD